MENHLNIWIRFLLPLFLALFLGTLIFMMAQFREPPGFTWYALVWFTGAIFLIWESGWYISKKLDKQFPWRKGTFRRLLVQLLATNLLGILVFLGSYVLLNLYENQGLGQNNPLGLLHILVTTAEAFLIVQITNSIQIGYQLLQNWQSVQLEAEAYKKESVVAQLENVRQQIDPYFLNNNFPKFEALLIKEPAKAAEFLKDLSENYQNSQALLDSNLITAQEELKVTAKSSKTNKKPLQNKHITTSFKKRFLVKSGSRLFLILISDVAVIYKDDIVMLYTKDGKKYPLDYSLEELMTLISPNCFFRINRQFIIHSRYLGEMRPENNQILIALTVPFPHVLMVSQRNVSPFKKWLNEE